MIGMFWPIRILASSFSSVIRFGVDSRLTLPLLPSARSSAPRPIALLTMPRFRPPTSCTSPCAAAMPAVRLLSNSAPARVRFRMFWPPVPKLVPAKTLLLPLDELISPCHWMPSSLACVAVTSTIIDSM
ncbi:hypothetical protein D9M72_328380 [compost metagenome]